LGHFAGQRSQRLLGQQVLGQYGKTVGHGGGLRMRKRALIIARLPGKAV
jgi:hypothetical protein